VSRLPASRRTRAPGAPGGLSRVKDDRGVALVEFALVAPVLFLLIFAIVDFGRVMNYWIDSTHLTNQGARWAAVGKNPGLPGQTLQQYLRSQASAGELRDGSGAVTERLRICVEYGPNGDAFDEPVRVTARFRFTFIPFLNLAETPVTVATTMRIEKATGTGIAAGCAT
jgi:Flp pilus assembly protein TadG